MNFAILSVAQRCGVPVLRMGQHYVAHCPFHGVDNTPSLIFYPETNSWACFGKCPQTIKGKRNGGGPVQFVEQYYRYTFQEAVTWLKRNFEFEAITIVEQKKEIIHHIVPHPWIIYWHSLLEEKRDYFRSRGFLDEFINREMWGWDGHRYTLPVWEGEPGNSDVLGVRRRKQENEEGVKYLGLKDMNPPTVWGRWYCRQQRTIFAFAGEFDAALANQDGYPSFSLVNGVNAQDDFPPDWPKLWFPDSQNMIVVFDRKEEFHGGRLCQAWNRIKGSMQARVFHWSLGDYKDYGEFRKDHSPKDFQDLILKEGLNVAINSRI